MSSLKSKILLHCLTKTTSKIALNALKGTRYQVALKDSLALPEDSFQTLIKFKEFKINGKTGTPGEKDRMTFSSLVFQIQIGRRRAIVKLKFVMQW